MLYNKIKAIFKNLILCTTLLLPCSVFTQVDNLADQLKFKLESGYITEAKKLLAKGLQNKYFLLVDCDDPSIDSVEIQISNPVFYPYQTLETRRHSLPYLSIEDSVVQYTELTFILIHDSLRVNMSGIYKPKDDCSRSHLAYLLLRSSQRTIDLKYCLELPAPPDTVEKLVIVKIPPPKFFNYRVLSSGGIALGSFIWFLREKVKANDDFDKYESAVSTPEAVKLRHDVEKSRTRRDIAGAISLVSGVAFSYFFVRDLFRSESEENLKHGVRSVDSTSKITFGLEPNPMTNDVLVTISLRF